MQANTPETTDKSRGARLEARISVEQKTVLQQAATLSGRTLSEFVVASAREAASRVIQEHETIRLSRTEQIAFVNALLHPPPPNARLRKAAAAYRKTDGVVIARARHAGKGIGQFLLMDALRRSLEAATHIAEMAVLAEAKDDAAEAFYRHFSFLPLQEQPRRLSCP